MSPYTQGTGATGAHELIDLHTHSSCSDGLLAPAALVELAATRAVRLLALTDHDSVAGLELAQQACSLRGIRFVPGVELSCDWQGRELHVVGLRIEPRDAGLLLHCEALGRLRCARLQRMGERLASLGMPADTLVAAALQAPVPTRTHLARALAAGGFARSTQEAFERYLAPGRPGFVAAAWPGLEQVMSCIRRAGGLAVLAHPHRYSLSAAQLRELLGRFKALGGEGLEVSLAGMGRSDTLRVETLAQRFELAGSVGSDFHEPGLPWRPLGRFAKLPAAIRPITARLGL
ncbi:MAG TPA: PHP domain-containing protein [Steroidobacteraceae bacterium]|nr:PHP domain-containing protein [Steroidobacteraceae bacterium]